jgi:3-hydroxyacyl-CoA dehydrogenase
LLPPSPKLECIEVYENPGYVTTRVILPMINQAMQVVLEGVATAEDVDTAMKLGYNMNIGPLALADRMGLDEVLKWMEHLFRELGDLTYRPCPILRMKVRAGLLGVKRVKGFFDYSEVHGPRFKKGTGFWTLGLRPSAGLCTLDFGPQILNPHESSCPQLRQFHRQVPTD